MKGDLGKGSDHLLGIILIFLGTERWSKMQSQLQRISQYGRKDRKETSISTQHASVRDQQQPRWNAEEQESVCQCGAGEVRTGFLAFYYDAIKIRKQLKKKNKSICLKIQRENWILSWQWGKLTNPQHRITTGSETKGTRDLRKQRWRKRGRREPLTEAPRPFKEERKISSTNGTGAAKHSHAKEWYFTPHTKINFKRI